LYTSDRESKKEKKSTLVHISYGRKSTKHFTIMAPRRRDRQTPDPPEEREIPRRRGRQLPDPSGARDMCNLHARMDAMEIAQRHAVGAWGSQ
jgi:hypothetical protein